MSQVHADKGGYASNAFFAASLKDADPEIAEAVELELGRQQHEIELIASENIVSRAVLEAQGSVLTNKYAEGYPGQALLRRLPVRRHRRDVWRSSADQALFGCALRQCAAEFRQLRPIRPVFLALLQPGDTFMGLDLAAGGHLTHGSPVNLSGKWFKPVPYGVRRDDHLHRHGRGREAGERA